jgi:hypothetical protein
MTTTAVITAKLGPRKVPESKWGKRRTITATLELHSIGDQAPYFSATAEVRNGYITNGDPIESCGCMHDEILRFFPDAAPVVAVHLSTEDGVPIHAFENARYWLGWTAYPEARDIDVFQRHLRIRDDEIESVVFEFAILADAEKDNALRSLIEKLSKRWQHEADLARYTIEYLAADNTHDKSIANNRRSKAAMLAAEVKVS